MTPFIGEKDEKCAASPAPTFGGLGALAWVRKILWE